MPSITQVKLSDIAFQCGRTIGKSQSLADRKEMESFNQELGMHRYFYRGYWQGLGEFLEHTSKGERGS